MAMKFLKRSAPLLLTATVVFPQSRFALAAPAPKERAPVPLLGGMLGGRRADDVGWDLKGF